MSTEPLAPRSRRALLAAAAGAGVAIAATAAAPAAMLAADPDDVAKGVDNPTTATTSVTNSGADSTALAGRATGSGSGFGIEGTSAGGAGVFAWSVSAPPSFDPQVTSYVGVYSWAPSVGSDSGFATGVWGDSDDVGVYGTGALGVYGIGGAGVVGEAANASGSIGLWGFAPSNAAVALFAQGKVRFSRSGRKSMGKGKVSSVHNLSGVTANSMVFAVLRTNESGRWVRAVVPAAGKFTIYLNAKLASSASVSWFVLD